MIASSTKSELMLYDQLYTMLKTLNLSKKNRRIYVCMCDLFKVGKIFKDSKLYLQDIQSLIKTDNTDIK